MTQGFILELLDQEEHESLHSWPLEENGEIALGRAQSCSVVLGDRFVSRLHARLARFGDGWILTTESNQGVVVDGRSVSSRL
ncbi:MAG: FHA domain-containing protein [Acidobacteriota bacterium]|nr:FHA domain-containing protein [Acidobacteriota bacterium]